MNKKQICAYLLLGLICTGCSLCVENGSEESQYSDTSSDSEESQYSDTSSDSEESQYSDTSSDSEESQYSDTSSDSEESQYSDTSSETPTQEVELTEAESQGLLRAKASGYGLELLKIVLNSLSDVPLKVTIEPGTIFEAHSAGTQSMVIRERKVVYLKPHTSKALQVLAACADMILDTPEEADGFTLRRTATSEDLVKLLNLPDFLEESFRVQQFAIWTITDNPSRSGYVGLGYDDYGTGPTHEEMCRIRALFERAGISVYAYQALRSVNCP